MSNANNLLSKETSPYLLQHADNPVNWHPWNSEALQLARQQNKPILLSVGYSACHWCHVMAHESFEDPQTAEIMNQHFINIKVDREERPDIDKIYQTAHSLLTNRPGGWPLTVFISPHNLMPFFAGTYFPNQRRYNMPSFIEIMQMVSDAYINKADDIKQQDNAIQQVIDRLSQHGNTPDELDTLPLDIARRQLASEFDSSHGGFSPAPKFPHCSMLERLLRHCALMDKRSTPDNEARNMLCFTLDKMASGGFQDHVGGGFYRYSTDKYWMIPHFEKMLYDNGQLLSIYALSFAYTQNPYYKSVAEHTADWAIRELQSELGGFFSALDADTEKVEGKFYVWTADEIKTLLSIDEYQALAAMYGLNKPANFEGKWHLHAGYDIDNIDDSTPLDRNTFEQLISNALSTLLNARNTRTLPARDDKILCSWNALMIRGLSLAGRHCNNTSYTDAANRAVDFIRKHMWHNKRLVASYKDGHAHLNAYLDDYAFLLQALIDLLQTRWNTTTYNWALEIADSMIEYFYDRDHGGFYFTSHDHEELLYRSKQFADEAIPNGNACAVSALYILGLLSGKTSYLEAAENTLKSAYSDLKSQAITHCALLNSLELHFNTPSIIILKGKTEHLAEWQADLRQHYSGQLFSFAIDTDHSDDVFTEKTLQGDICAYICEGTQCLPVITKKQEFLDYIAPTNP